MKPQAILGLGSAHGDDQVGWEVIKLLQDDPPADTLLQAVSNPGAALLQDLQAYSRVILVDACDCCAAAGELFHYTDAELVCQADAKAVSSHHLGLAELLQMAAVLNMTLPPLEVFAVQIQGCEPMASLSEAVSEALPALVQQIRQRLNDKELTDV